MSHAVAASMLACSVGDLGSSLTYIIPSFFCNMSVMASKAMMLFSFVFICNPVQLVSQHERLKIHQYLTTVKLYIKHETH
jgi:hypothetical protein